MKVISVNVGLPREVMWKGRTVTTGIFKDPVTGRVQIRRLNLDGDKQADLSVHGGPEKDLSHHKSPPSRRLGSSVLTNVSEPGRYLERGLGK